MVTTRSGWSDMENFHVPLSWKMKIIRGNKVFNKSCRIWFKVLFQFFLFSRNLKNERARTKTCWFFCNFEKSPENLHVLALACSFWRFRQYKKIWNSYSGHFQQILLKDFFATNYFHLPTFTITFFFWSLIT